MNLENLSNLLSDQPRYRYQQIHKYLYQDFISSWDEASTLPKSLRVKLEIECPLEIKAQVLAGDNSKSHKAILELEDGVLIETVLIEQYAKDNKKRHTVCLSSQAGCALGCTFCESGRDGLKRNLRKSEILEQLIYWGRYLQAPNKIDNIVFMGMGEPMLNYDEVMGAVRDMNDEEKFNIGARRISISTAGILPGLKRLKDEDLQINLAISLHAPSDKLRQIIMPRASKYTIKQIFQEADRYIEKTNRRLMIEYVMLKDINDSPEQAKELASLINNPLYFLNLIPYNETGIFEASSLEEIEYFKSILEENGISVTIRHSFGGEISAACGQLRKSHGQKK
jgi:23S rRNA (adenine2503-C2)-methyltransferase